MTNFDKEVELPESGGLVIIGLNRRREAIANTYPYPNIDDGVYGVILFGDGTGNKKQTVNQIWELDS